MADIFLEHFPDGGSVYVISGTLVVDDGLGTAVYLSFFGGNNTDEGIEATEGKQFWANRIVTDPAAVLRGTMHALIKASPIVPARLLRIEQAGANDLQWLVDQGLVDSLAVEASILGVDRIQIDVRLLVGEEVQRLSYEVTRAPAV